MNKQDWEDLDNRIKKIQEDHEEWEHQFNERMENLENLESRMFLERVAESAFDILLSEATENSGEFGTSTNLDPECVAQRAWKYADKMEEERRKRFPKQ